MSLHDSTDPDFDFVRHQRLIEEREERRKLDALALRLGLTVDDAMLFLRNGFDAERIPARNTPNRRGLIAYLKKSEVGLPKWIHISGLVPEVLFSEPDRRKRLRALYDATVLLIKRALGREAAEPHLERSIYWDPTAEVCRDLEIAPSKLSSLLKECSGHSLSQLIDCVRAEKIQKLLRGKIRCFVQEFRTQCATSAAENGEKITAWEVWKALKASRKWPEFCQNTWALEFGFSSYRKMYRACMAVWKQTPHQMEMKLIVEFLQVDSLQNEGKEVVNTISDDVPLSLIEEQVRGIRAYSDDS